MIQVKKGENGFLGRNIPDTNVCHSVVCSETMSYFLLVGPGVQGVQVAGDGAEEVDEAGHSGALSSL